MKRKEVFFSRGRECAAYFDDEPAFLLIQPAEKSEMEKAKEVIQVEEKSSLPFCHLFFSVRDWECELSPWRAPAPFGKEDFKGEAGETLAFLTTFLPEWKEKFCRGEAPVILGGYSLAGLFALWAGRNSDLFSGIAAASPSVWYPGWEDFAKENGMRAKAVFLSLGDREDRTKNPVMKTVSRAIRNEEAILKSQGVRTEFEWNEGNHFQDAPERTGKAFLRCMEAIEGSRDSNETD